MAKLGDGQHAREKRTSSTRITQADVARRAGVSVATVSFVLNGRSGRPHPASEATRNRILEAAADLGYRPHRAGRNLRRGRTELVAIVHAPPMTPWIEELSRQLELAAAPRGYSVVHLLMHTSDESERTTEVLANGLVDAVIVVGNHLSAKQRSRLAGLGLVVTFVAEELRPRRFDVVHQHVAEGMRLATRYLADSGRQRIAYLGNQDERRLGGYQQGLRQSRVDLDPSICTEVGESRDEMLHAALQLLQKRPCPDALLAGTDRAAIATLWAARSLNLQVPNDVAVIGAGNTPEGHAVRPALTTVGPAELDFTEVVDRLFARIDEPDLPGRTLHTPWRIVHRDSA